ncbi:choline monooxygenase [Oxalobacteraceae bacterium GrIS 2.11]
MTLHIDPDITTAHTLDSAFYTDQHNFDLARERIFTRTWQWLGSLDDVSQSGSVAPRELLPGLLNEPVLLSRDDQGQLRCLSNVCTHRGNILVQTACKARHIRCGYHGRRFDLSGEMMSMPEFADAKNFPAATDNLPTLPVGQWNNHGFAALDPAAPLDTFFSEVSQRLSWLPVDTFIHDPKRDQNFFLNAHWALYVENYLEGFHIPFVHAGLNAVVDYSSYTSEIGRYANLQLAIAKEGESAFDIPLGSPDHGKRVAAYYYWVFPNLMLNFYPWGLSLNIIHPEGLDKTRISFRSFIWDASKLDQGAGSSLDQVEMEDEAIVLAVQRGVRSRFYQHGRYSPTRERGTHHFHRLIAEFMQGS